MGSGIYFPISALVFSLIIIVLFFNKKSIKSFETTIYKYLLLSNFFGLIIELLCTYAAYINATNALLSDIILKSYLVYNVFWVLVLTVYVFYISMKKGDVTKKNSLIQKGAAIVFVISVLLIFILRCDLIIENNFATRYTQGPSVNFTYLISSVCIFLMIVLIVINRHSLTKKYIPIYSFLITIVIGMIIQMNVPGLLIMTYIETVTVTIMFFTIENPDIKMLNVLYKNKELMEQNYEDKYNFLFEITQEARNPLLNIARLCNEIKNEEDIEKIKVGTLAIGNIVKQLDFSINNIMNISTLDVQKLHVVDSKYSLNKLCLNVVTRCKNDIKDDIDFKYSYPNEDIILYGDYMKIRQILYSLILNSSQKTNQGYVNFKVNIIEKYDVCRLIFTITDSGQGIPTEKINEILSATGELSKQELEELEMNEFNVKLCQKVIKIMGGHLMIKSNLGKGTELKLTIDQRVHHNEDNSLLNQYENVINNYKRILLVSQDKRIISRIRNICREKNIRFSSLLYGKDAIDRIKSGRKYDYILISDEMKEMSGLMTLRGMQEIDNFKIPTIVILGNNGEQIKKHYLNDGFSDYLLLNDFEAEINRIIDKY